MFRATMGETKREKYISFNRKGDDKMSRRTKEKKNIVVTFTKVEYDEEVQQEVTSEVTKEGPMTLMEALKLMNRLTRNNGLHVAGSKDGFYETDWTDVYEDGSFLWKDIVKFEEV